MILPMSMIHSFERTADGLSTLFWFEEGVQDGNRSKFHPPQKWRGEFAHQAYVKGWREGGGDWNGKETR